MQHQTERPSTLPSLSNGWRATSQDFQRGIRRTPQTAFFADLAGIPLSRAGHQLPPRDAFRRNHSWL